MAQISVNDLSFCYEGSYDYIFENVSFTVDTDWKLGFIGRNGKGKTTFLRLLQGKYEYSGTISSNEPFDYFPYEYGEADLALPASELLERWKPSCEEWRVLREMDELELSAEDLYRPFGELSLGQRTKIMLAVLFSGEGDFLLIDEPTNNLDAEARQTIRGYLASKKGFILVSHDAALLDAVIDHVLVLNRSSIEVQAGNFTSWWENKEKADSHARRENEKHLKEISHMKQAADKVSRWADKSENSKIGHDPIKERDHNVVAARSYVGGKTKKAEARAKAFEQRMDRSIKQKEGLMNDVEREFDLKITTLEHFKKKLVRCADLSISYSGSDRKVIDGLNFEIEQGERVFLSGGNGCGKSTLIKAILGGAYSEGMEMTGVLEKASGLIISYVNQDTTRLAGSLRGYASENGLDYTLFLSLLNKLDFDKVQYEKDLRDLSEGQKKKVLIAGSLITPAHLYIWDEPLNYIDVFSRRQIEKLITEYQPTMIMVEHDSRFREKTATRVVEL
ncbi:MAG: ABC-F family ATP-binding cassette domain-containing protein [Clostridiales bacterium]|nr:ABC-F family ATP-binding cassette domain-containing protein [Clostridiales bacterium]